MGQTGSREKAPSWKDADKSERTEEFAPWSNGLMKDFRLGNFRPVVSEIVTAEIEDNAPDEVQEQHEWLLDLGPECLEVDEQVVSLADAYLERGILTSNYYDDALHVALAWVNAIEMLVSWSFRHIVHFDKIRKFNAVNIILDVVGEPVFAQIRRRFTFPLTTPVKAMSLQPQASYAIPERTAEVALAAFPKGNQNHHGSVYMQMRTELGTLFLG